MILSQQSQCHCSKGWTFLAVGFLAVDPVRREEHDDFKHPADIVTALKVVSEQAKHAIALIQEFSGLITH